MWTRRYLLCPIFMISGVTLDDLVDTPSFFRKDAQV